MFQKFKSSLEDKYNKHFKKENYQEMKDEVQQNGEQSQQQQIQQQTFNMANQIGQNGENENQPQENNGNSQDKVYPDFSKALIPEELVQQMQEEEMKKIAEENAKKTFSKKKENNDLPQFLNTTILLNEKGENYYEVAAKQAKKQNSTMAKLSDYVSNKANNAKHEVRKQLRKLDSVVKKTILEKKQHINVWIAGQVDDKVVNIMNSMEPKIEESIKKSVPFDFMQDFAHDTALNFWKDFTDLIRLELRIRVVPPKMQIRKREVKGSFQQLRTFILYSLYPADLTARNHMRRLSFLIMKTLQLTPYLGLQPLTFIIILICINKDEEYQLTNFIADYKSLQFLTNGLFPCLIAYFHYFLYGYGPGEHELFHLIIFTLITQVVTIWVTYYLLSKSYSRLDLSKVELGLDSNNNKSSRLRTYLIYDAICLLITVALSIWVYFEKFYDTPTKQIGELLFFTRTVYAFFSFPFLVFLFPFFVKMLTNASPTGYDQYGNCIPSVSTLQISYMEVPLDRTEKVDIEDILDKGTLSDEEHDKKIEKEKQQEEERQQEEKAKDKAVAKNTKREKLKQDKEIARIQKENAKKGILDTSRGKINPLAKTVG